MSITLDKLRALKREAGGAVAAGRVAATATEATGSTQPTRPTPTPVSTATATATPAAVAPTATSLDTLRRLLGVRERAPAYPVAARGPVDRSLPGDEIAPGLRLIEAHLPFPAPVASLPLAFARRDDAVALRDLLFFDTETTGLAGGTGTRAFQIGAADWHVHPVHGDGLRVRQLLITTLAAERAMLREFADWLSPGTVLSSYNGRCYDAPLLKTRYRLARLPCPVTPLDHVDLLFPTRRRYRGVWENCRLATIERELLKIVREDDLPGSEAPAAWLSYLRGGASTLLRRVCAHNHQDVVTLARLMLRLVEAESESPAAPATSRRVRAG
ncbi:ribonuclease H-like domain-containing protein [Novilysobacter arseniciresistens]|uniref:ribonuclease H-like domain-containing protein n=1 Tax=Novilysobacter arseniciresistens TaxID=1385522 RepID=UPI0006914CC3|nr:ribonuclease H-like domain-containing protein [Lysobacter arseniciresistens]